MSHPVPPQTDSPPEAAEVCDYCGNPVGFQCRMVEFPDPFVFCNRDCERRFYQHIERAMKQPHYPIERLWRD